MHEAKVAALRFLLILNLYKISIRIEVLQFYSNTAKSSKRDECLNNNQNKPMDWKSSSYIYENT